MDEAQPRACEMLLRVSTVASLSRYQPTPRIPTDELPAFPPF